ncbi:MAG: condensation domain-containing protein [Actinoallomurus sp.]
MYQIEKILPLNTAQLRNLRNWDTADWSSVTIPVVVECPQGISRREMAEGIGVLLERHEALRSRLREGVQEVLSRKAVDLPTRVVSEGSDEELEAHSWIESVPPDVAALKCLLVMSGGAVRLVKLSVSHVFVDALGARALASDLDKILRARVLDSALPCQAGVFAQGVDDPEIRANTERWKAMLADMPRSCTYSGVSRDAYEPVEHVVEVLSPDHENILAEACTELRASSYAVMAAVMSSIVQGISGHCRQVLRSTYANRFSPADFGAVAQVAQAVFVPIDGAGNDTFAERVEKIARSTLSTYHLGRYDANGLLDWLDSGEVGRSAAFQPAFEVNYVPSARDESEIVTAYAETAESRTYQTRERIDPRAAKPDLVLSVTYEPGLVLLLSARRPVYDSISISELMGVCIDSAMFFCANPHTPVEAVSPPESRNIGERLLGHRSGVTVDVPAVQALVTSYPGIESCSVEMRSTEGPGPQLLARVRASRPVHVEDVLRTLRQKQPWMAGSVVPDQLIVTELCS